MPIAPARLRNRFDGGIHPPAQGLPDSHHRDCYLATDGSLRIDGAGMGVVAETFEGDCIGRWSRPASTTDNNAAELLALHWGLDLLSTRIPPAASIGIIVDHEQLALGLAEAIGQSGYQFPDVPISTASEHHWGGILARISGFRSVGVAHVPGSGNPAHPLANARYAPVVRDRCPWSPRLSPGY